MPPITESVVSYAARGPYGNGGYHGVTNGWFVRDVIETYRPRHVIDPMCGGGTVLDVCNELGIPVKGYDILRGDNILDIRTRDKMTEDVAAMTDGLGVDMIWWDPPYYNMAIYNEDPADFCQGSYTVFLARMQSTMKFLATLLAKDGFIALELGDLRRPHRTYFICDDVTTSAKVAEARLWKEMRFINWFTPVIRNPERFMEYLDKLKVKPTDGLVELNHETLTILRKQ